MSHRYVIAYHHESTNTCRFVRSFSHFIFLIAPKQSTSSHHNNNSKSRWETPLTNDRIDNINNLHKFILSLASFHSAWRHQTTVDDRKSFAHLFAQVSWQSSWITRSFFYVFSLPFTFNQMINISFSLVRSCDIRIRRQQQIIRFCCNSCEEQVIRFYCDKTVQSDVAQNNGQRTTKFADFLIKIFDWSWWKIMTDFTLFCRLHIRKWCGKSKDKDLSETVKYERRDVHNNKTLKMSYFLE